VSKKKKRIREKKRKKELEKKRGNAGRGIV